MVKICTCAPVDFAGAAAFAGVVALAETCFLSLIICVLGVQYREFWKSEVGSLTSDFRLLTSIKVVQLHFEVFYHAPVGAEQGDADAEHQNEPGEYAQP